MQVPQTERSFGHHVRSVVCHNVMGLLVLQVLHPRELSLLALFLPLETTRPAMSAHYL